MGHNGYVIATELRLPDLRGQEPEDAKQQLRGIIRISRNRLTPTQIEELGGRISARALELAKDFQTIACYISVRTEPPTLDLVEALYEQGKTLLIPKLGPRLNRDWGYYKGRDDLADLSPNRPKEPSGDAFDSSVLAEADFVFTPALAVDREGNRLGQGGGWYDRALPYVKPHTPVFALLYTNELVNDIILPTNQYDYPVTGVVTPDFAFALEGSQFREQGIRPLVD